MRLFAGVAALVLLVVFALRERFPRNEAPASANPSAQLSTPRSAGENENSGNATAATELGVTYVVPTTGSIFTVPAEQMRDVIRARRRVRPDRRLLLAVADVHRLVTGTARRPVYARWVDSSWVIEYGDGHVVVGRLPELPSLENARAILEAWATGIARQRPLPLVANGDPAQAETMRRALASLDAPTLIDALATIDKEWQRARNPNVLPWAAQALAMLTMFVDDRTDMADALFARALATSAAARALSPNPPRRTDALLAYEMGYISEARDSARTLGTDDGIRLSMERDDSALVRLVRAVEQSDPDPFTRYLAIRRAAERSAAAWDSVRTKIGPWTSATTAGIESGFASGKFDLQRELPQLFAMAALAELEQVGQTSRVADRLFGSKSPIGFLRHLDIGFRASLGRPKEVAVLEQRLADAGKRFQGVFVDSSVIDGYYRSAYFAALDGEARFDLETLSSVSASTALATRLKGDQPSGAGSQYAGWVEHLAEAKSGRAQKQLLASDLANARTLGHRQLKLTFDAFAAGATFAEHIEVAGVARAYAARLDSRPDHVNALAALSYSQLWDMPNAERLYRRYVDLDRDDGAVVPWVARLMRDTTTLRRMLEDAETPHDTRVEIARLMGVDTLTSLAYVRRWFDQLVAARPGDWPTRRAYVEVLERYKDAATVERIAREWLERSSGSARDSFEPVNARVALSKALTNQRRYDDAWTVIEPALSSYVGSAMVQGVRVLSKLGRLDDARTLADALVDRYPDLPNAHVQKAAVLWRQGRQADAAKYLHEHENRFDAWTWRREVAASFIEVFGDRQEPEWTSAMQQLAAAQIPGWLLGQLGMGLKQLNRPDLAFAMQLHGSEATGAGNVRLPMQAYKSLRAWQGDAAALNWLRQFARGVEGATAMILYQDDAFEELWTLDPPGRAYSPFTWLLRASAAASSAAVARRHRDELLAYYARPIRDDYFVMGRYVMGLASEHEMLALAKTPERRCEVAYYLGVRAKAQGRMYDAADWFAVALETQQMNEGELVWAQQQLDEWRSRGRALGVK